MDVSDPQNPFEAGIWETNGMIYDVALNGDYAYVADPLLGLHVVNVSDPVNPEEANVFRTMYSQTVRVHEDKLFLYSSTLRIYDLADPEQPQLVGTYDPPEIGIEGMIYDIEFNGNYVYAISNAWFRVIDISVPSEPAETGYIETGGSGTDIALSGTQAYISEGPDSIVIYDISNPAELARVSAFGLTGHNEADVMDLMVEGGFLYISDKNFGLRVWNVSNLAVVQLVGWHTAEWYSRDVIADGNIAYLNSQFGIEIFDVSAALGVDEIDPPVISEFILHPVYPNPFNNTANISFDLPREVTGRLVVYDVLGREANVLYNGRMESGSHQMQFNANSLSSGTYFIQLKTPTYNATQKAVLLK